MMELNNCKETIQGDNLAIDINQDQNAFIVNKDTQNKLKLTIGLNIVVNILGTISSGIINDINYKDKVISYGDNYDEIGEYNSNYIKAVGIL